MLRTINRGIRFPTTYSPTNERMLHYRPILALHPDMNIPNFEGSLPGTRGKTRSRGKERTCSAVCTTSSDPAITPGQPNGSSFCDAMLPLPPPLVIWRSCKFGRGLLIHASCDNGRWLPLPISQYLPSAPSVASGYVKLYGWWAPG